MLKIIPLSDVSGLYSWCKRAGAVPESAPATSPSLGCLQWDVYVPRAVPFLLRSDQTATFFTVSVLRTGFDFPHCLYAFREVNVFGMDTKNGVPKAAIIQGVKRVKTLADILPIQINNAPDFQVPYAQFSFPAPGQHVEMHISHFLTKT